MNTPECDKLAAVGEQARAIQEFLEWLGTANYMICEIRGDEYFPTMKRPEELVCDLFGIDAVALEKERAALLKSCQANEPSS